jgi:hypothetical protein
LQNKSKSFTVRVPSAVGRPGASTPLTSPVNGTTPVPPNVAPLSTVTPVEDAIEPVTSKVPPFTRVAPV